MEMEAVRVRYNEGVLAPLHPLCFQEGEEIEVYIVRSGKDSVSTDRKKRGGPEYKTIHSDDDLQQVHFGEVGIMEKYRNQAFDAIQKIIDDTYPNLAVRITPQIKAVAGFSFDMNQKYAAFCDKEILAMERMKKYLEEGDVIENLS